MIRIIVSVLALAMMGCGSKPQNKGQAQPVEEAQMGEPFDVLSGTKLLELSFGGATCGNSEPSITEFCEVGVVSIKLGDQSIDEVVLTSDSGEKSLTFTKTEAQPVFENIYSKLGQLRLVKCSDEEEYNILGVYSLKVTRDSSLEEYIEHAPECLQKDDELRGISSVYRAVSDLMAGGRISGGEGDLTDEYLDVLAGASLIRMGFVGASAPFENGSEIKSILEVRTIEITPGENAIEEITFIRDEDFSISVKHSDAPMIFDDIHSKLRTLKLVKGTGGSCSAVAGIYSLDVERGSTNELFVEYTDSCPEVDQLKGIGLVHRALGRLLPRTL